uniref:HTH La-type RNA-binding domain-containing protein n=1 Tax=Mesocestoides corti TaxID=53468 RepID=A0A5K3FBP8_MESCO
PFPILPPQGVFSTPSVLTSPNTNADYYSRYARLPSSNSLSSDLSVGIEKDFRVVSWEELRTLLPEAPSDGRVESGLLSDGRAFAQKTARKDNYFLFPSKSAYILYFTHYYFSRENLDRDQTIRKLMTDNAAVPIEKIIEAPRLASIGTTVDDMKKAIETCSNLLCLVNSSDGRCFVRRIDGYPGNAPSPSNTGGLPLDAKTRASFDGSLSSLGFSDHASPAASVDPTLKDEVSTTIPGVVATTVYNLQYANPVDTGLYQQPPAFIRPTARPPSAATISSTMAAAMAAMTLGQPPPHPPPTTPHLFSHLQPQNQLAATFAVLSHRGTALALASHLNQQYNTVQSRGATAPPSQTQQQMYHHRRTTPPPPPQAAAAAANFYQFPPPQFYAFHHPHENNPPPQFAAAAAYQPQHYDQWSADAANAALAATGIQLQYAPPQPHMMVWSHTQPQIKTLSQPPQAPLAPQSTVQSAATSTTVDGAVSGGSSGGGVHPCAKDDPSIVAVTDANVDAIPKKTAVSPPQPHSRPNSGASAKGKFKSSKGGGGHHQRPLHVNRSPPAASSAKESTPVGINVSTEE